MYCNLKKNVVKCRCIVISYWVFVRFLIFTYGVTDEKEEINEKASAILGVDHCIAGFYLDTILYTDSIVNEGKRVVYEKHRASC